MLLNECIFVCVSDLVWCDEGKKHSVGACSLFILQINLISNLDAEQRLVQRKGSPSTTLMTPV